MAGAGPSWVGCAMVGPRTLVLPSKEGDFLLQGELVLHGALVRSDSVQ